MPPQDQSTAVMATYGRFPVKLERGQGVWVRDSQGRRYLDCVAGIAPCTLGHIPIGAVNEWRQFEVPAHFSCLGES